MAIHEGDTVTLWLHIENRAGPLTNASEVTVTVKTPDGTPIGPLMLTSGQITNAGGGDYRVDINLEEAGYYHVVWRTNSPANEKKSTQNRFHADPLYS